MDSQAGAAEGAGALRYHGGNISAAMVIFPDAPKPWIDLSTGINPTAYPVGAISESAWSRLPEPSEVAALEAAARHAYRVQPSAGIVAAPGTQGLIQWLPRLFPARRVGILGFTYREHEVCWRQAGADVTTVTAIQDLVEFDIAVVVNPNNPDGRIVAPSDLAGLAGILVQRGGRVIVDEAFMDLAVRQDSLVPCLPAAGAVVLRSFGKTYGLAGLRLGFAIASIDDTAQLRTAMGPWAVSGPAIEIGKRALMDETWRLGTAARLHQSAGRLDKMLQQAGFHVIGGTALFRLGQHDDAAQMFERLCRTGILTRPFQARTDLLRFGIPNREAEWERLATALERDRLRLTQPRA